MTFGSLFSGIGGIDLGLERAAFECRWQVENDAYATKVLERHWPGVKRYGDIKTVRGTDLEPVDLIAGGFPCQDLSQAGKRAGIEGDRSGLWFEFARLIGELRPRYVLIENVPGLLNGRLEEFANDRCLCGWISGRRGLHQHLVRQAEPVLLSKGRHWNDDSSEADVVGSSGHIWRDDEVNAGGDRQVGRGLGLDDHRKTSERVHRADSAALKSEGRASANLPESTADGRRPGTSRKRKCEMDGGCAGEGESTSDFDSGVESEGSTGTDSAELVCEGCGRLLVNSTSRYAFRSGIQRVLRDLSGLGYLGEWLSLRASEFGAGHIRKRVFIVAYNSLDFGRRESFGIRGGAVPTGIGTDQPTVANSERAKRRPHIEHIELSGRRIETANRLRRVGSELENAARDEQQGCEGEGGRMRRRGVCIPSEQLADTGDGQLQEPRRGSQGRNGIGPASADVREHLADTASVQPELAEGIGSRSREAERGRSFGELAGRRNDLPSFAPGPSDPRWPAILRERPDLAPALESPLRGVAHELSDWMDRAMQNRTKRLGRLGNAVVPKVVQYIGEVIMAFDISRACERKHQRLNGSEIPQEGARRKRKVNGAER